MPQVIVPLEAVEGVLVDIQDKVNQDIKPGDDLSVFGELEHWATVYSGLGDCDDYAVTKLRYLCELLQKALPDHARAFRLATCCEGLNENGGFVGYHLVLLVHTDRGVYVLDNLYAWPMAIWAIKGRVWCYQEPAKAGGPWVHFKKPQGARTILVLTPDMKVI